LTGRVSAKLDLATGQWSHTLWERWEDKTGGQMNSHNHPMMGSVGSWLYKYAVGVLPDVRRPGFEKFTIKPYILDQLTFVEGKYIPSRAWSRVLGRSYQVLSIWI
jgi:hypothetical protein